MKAPSKDMMNTLSRSVLTLASYDDNVADPSIRNVLRQCLMLIAVFPMLAVYGYHSYNHYERDESFYIHRPDENLSAAENLLRMLRPDKSYTDLEAHVLDLALILHMEHGGGNNSSFTTLCIPSATHAPRCSGALSSSWRTRSKRRMILPSIPWWKGSRLR